MGNSKLRGSETVIARDGSPSPKGATAYLMIYNAVRAQPGLTHGMLDNKKTGEHCAIGSYFAINRDTSLGIDVIDEVAMVNDSVPTASSLERKRIVSRWLKWKLCTLGMPGFEKATKP